MPQLEGFFAQLADTLDAIDFHKGRAPGVGDAQAAPAVPARAAWTRARCGCCAASWPTPSAWRGWPASTAADAGRQPRAGPAVAAGPIIG